MGAVTHVFVQDSARGYGIFIENMLRCRILTRKGDKFWLRFSPSLTIIFIVFDRAKTKKDLEERPDGKAECGHC
ncbi:MAG: SpoIVB peptidase S55 domain-containing protein [Lachnospiraceae bacterium]